MWLGLMLAIIIVLALVASIFSGGIFTIVVLPLAVVIAFVVMIVAAWGRGSARSKDPPRESAGRAPLPHSGHSNTAPAPTTPDQLVDARRAQQ